MTSQQRLELLAASTDDLDQSGSLDATGARIGGCHDGRCHWYESAPKNLETQ